MAPFDLSNIAGTLPFYGIYLLIGMAFGAVLELGGFGDSRKLAAQFYLNDMTVLKVMFTGIIVASVLIFGASSLGMLDFSRVWVNPTYLVPGIVGGLIMGLGFIVGGFCPGTSLVATATLKLDGAFFLAGVGLGVLAFSETVHLFEGFWNSSFMGRFMLPELFGLSTGITILLLVGMALIMFFGAEISERILGDGQRATRQLLRPHNKFHMAGAAVLLATAGVFAFVGQPSAQDRWENIAKTAGAELNNREPFILPLEVVEWKEDPAVYVQIIDVRSEADFNLFHLFDSRRVSFDSFNNDSFIKELLTAPENTLIFVISNTERYATDAWKILKGQGVPNVYIVDGGINKWLATYPPDPCVATPIKNSNNAETLAFNFIRSVGDQIHSAHPEARFKVAPTDCFLASHPNIKPGSDKANRVHPDPFGGHGHEKPKFIRKVKMKKKAAIKGGCG